MKLALYSHKSTESEPTITLTEANGQWLATDTETGVTSQGQTSEQALDNLKEALRGFHGIGEQPTDADLEALGIDPANNESGSVDESDVFR